VTKPEVARPVPPVTRLSWQRKLLFATLTAGGFFLLLELVLAALGIQPVRSQRDPFVGFEPGAPLFVRRGDRYVTNPVKLSSFNPQEFPITKSRREYRIFCLGGSTTYGHPYDHRTYFGAWLQQYLQEVAPERDWQVINCGGMSYASYRVALLLEELAGYEPDLFIVYTGHNEFLEERHYGTIRQRPAALQRLLRWASYSRTYRVLEAAVRAAPPEPGQRLPAEVRTTLEVVGPDAYHRDVRWRAGVLEHFRVSLRRIAATARRAGARVIFVQPASNLKDFTPFKSEHGELDPAGLRRWETLIAEGRKALSVPQQTPAIAAFQEAARIDPQHAQGLWYLADALLAAQRDEEALEFFTRAKDEDVCPLRALSELRAIIADVANENGVAVVDYPRLLTQKYGRWPAVGLECFLDHVHPTVDAHGDLGAALAEQLRELGVIRAFARSAALDERVRRQVLGPLRPSDHARALHTLALTLSWGGKTREALRLAEEAERLDPQSPAVRQRRQRPGP
jgi:tetratricopeptide (TPR) repeat protein